MIRVCDIDEARLALAAYPDVYLVYDRNLARAASVLEGFCYATKAITATEPLNSMDTVLEICRWLMKMGADRGATLVALGGGITTDICGFAASIYKRGIRFGFVPTTLLSQVDAAIGGKNGVNLDAYKNMLGVIREPAFSLIVPSLLDTLPLRQWRSGAAELLKTLIIGGGRHYEKAVDELNAPQTVQDLAPLIKEAARIKARVVESDPDEKGRRRVLNLGHTYAHAIEWYQHTHGVSDPYSHGEAVAIGLVQAARLSEERGICEKGLALKLEEDLRRCGLPTTLPCPEADLQEAILKDKKADGGKVNFVFIERIGKVTVKKL